MKDVHNYLDKRGIEIAQCGITNLKLPLRLKDRGGEQMVTADAEMSVNLCPEKKGAHMSRFIELSQSVGGSVLSNCFLENSVKKIKERLDSKYAKIKFSFIYFLNKKTPVTNLKCQTDYFCEVTSEIDDGIIKHTLKVEIPITTLCPCSKVISAHAGHNQRAKIILLVLSEKFIDIEKFIRSVEKNICGEIYSLLKRPDEKFVTDRAYNNPMFVEDVVREIALFLENKKRTSTIYHYKVTCKSYESVHNHNVSAEIGNKNMFFEKKRRGK